MLHILASIIMFKLFKNSKAAKKYLSHIEVNLYAVDNHLKPCYLWDTFIADVSEIQDYLNELHLSGKTNWKLSVFSVYDTYLITQANFLNSYLEDFKYENVKVVDVSDSRDKPIMLYDEDKAKALKPIIEYLKKILLNLTSCHDQNQFLDVEFATCNITTLFGVLLGYPVVYWYKNPTSENDFTCLSMTPLNVYKVVNTKEILMSASASNNKMYKYEIFSFSSPQCLRQEIECAVDTWFTNLEAKCINSIFNDLTLNRNTVVMSQVSM